MAFATSQNTDQLLTRGLAFRLPNNAPISTTFTLYANGAGQTYWSNSLNPSALSTLSTTIGDVSNITDFQSTQISDLYGQISTLSTGTATSISSLSNYLLDYVNSSITGLSTFSTFYNDLFALSNQTGASFSSMSTLIFQTNSTTTAFLTSSLTSSMRGMTLSSSGGLYRYINTVSAATVFYPTFYSTTNSLNRATLSTSTGLNNQINATNLALSTNISTLRFSVTSTNNSFFSTINGYGPRIGALESASTNTSTVTGIWISSQIGVSQSTQNAGLNARFQQLSTYVSTIAIFATAQFGSLSSLSSALYTSIVANNSTNDTQNAQISTLARNLSILTTSSILAGVYDTFMQLEAYTVGLINSTIAFTYYWQSSLFISTYNQNTLLSQAYFSTFTGTAYLSTVSATSALNEAYVSSYTAQLYSTSLSGVNANNSTQISVLYSTGYQYLTSTLVSSIQSIPAPLRSTVVFIGSNAASTNQGQYGIAVGFNAGRVNQLTNAVAIGREAGNLYQQGGTVAIGYLAGRSSQGDTAVAVGAYSGEQAQGYSAVAIGSYSGQSNQGLQAIAIGDLAGGINQGDAAVAIGENAGNENQSTNAVAIGNNAGNMNQGAYAVAVGFRAGQNDQAPNTIVINASGSALNTSTLSDCLYIAPIRNDETLLGGFLHYDPATKEIVFNDQGGSGISKNSTFTQPVYMSSINTIGGNFLINTAQGGAGIDFGANSFIPLVPYSVVGTDVVACSANGQNVLFQRTDGTYGVSTDYGLNFTFTACPTSGNVSCAMNANGTYMITTFYNGDTSIFYVSNNTGTSFTAFTRAYGFAGGVDYTACAVSASGQYMAVVGIGNPTGTTVLTLSTDYGATWTRNLTVPTFAGFPRACSISDDGQTIIIGFVIATGNNATYTTNGGSTWTSINIGGGGTNYLYSLTMAGDASYFLAGTSNSSGDSEIYGSMVIGTGFSVLQTSTYPIQSIAINRPNGLYIIAGTTDMGGSSTYFTSQDGGMTWSARFSAVMGDWYSFAMSDDGVYTYSVPLVAPGLMSGPVLAKTTSGPTLTLTNIGVNKFVPTATLDISGSLAFSTINVPQFFVEITDPNAGIVIGNEAGLYNRGITTIAIGAFAGQSTQQSQAIAIGVNAGALIQGVQAVSIGKEAGYENQGTYSVALGLAAGGNNQGIESVAIGRQAGQGNQGSSNTAIGSYAGQLNQNNFATAIGAYAGNQGQGQSAVAIGNGAGSNAQDTEAVAVGYWAGLNTQGQRTIAVGYQAGRASQGPYSVAIGPNAGDSAQGTNAVAIGYAAGFNTQGTNAVALGNGAGNVTQGLSAVALGDTAGNVTQGNYSVAIGSGAGNDTQGIANVAIGLDAGHGNQSNAAVAIGTSAGFSSQGSNAVAIGNSAGYTTQGCNAIAIGSNAGSNAQGNYAIAIGNQAGETAQNANSIVLNASNAALNTGAAGFYVNPVRSNAAITGGFVHYDAVNKELVYNEAGGSVSSFNNIFFSTATGVSTVSRAARFNILNASSIGGFSPITFTDSIVVLGSTVTSNFYVSGNFTTVGPTNASSINTSSITTGVLNASTINTSSITATQLTALRQINASSINVSSITTAQIAFTTASIGLGASAGATGQGVSAVAIGTQAGSNTQETLAIAVGNQAGFSGQKTAAVAIGNTAGYSNQAGNTVAIGTTAGYFGQSTFSVAIGTDAGFSNQNSNSVAIGPYAGRIAQGQFAVAIGFAAGSNAQNPSSIVINATASALPATASGFYVNPVRSNAAITGGFVHYDSVNKELVFNEVGGSGGGTISTYNQLFVSSVVASTLTTNTVFYSTLTGSTLTTATASVGEVLPVSPYTAGITWTSKLTTAAYYGAAMSYDGQIQAVAITGGGIVVSTDFGATWTLRASTQNWQNIAMSYSGKYMTAATNGARVWRSSDFGATWTQITALAASVNWFGIAVSASGQYQTAGAADSNGIWTSSDYGVTWTNRDSAQCSHIGMSATGQYQAYAATLTVRVSSDYGVNWTLASSISAVRQVVVSASGQYMVAFLCTGVIRYSSNFGVTWSVSDSPNTCWLGGGMTAAGNILIAGGSPNAYYSTNFGANWTAFSDANTNGWQYATISPNGVYSIGTKNTGLIWTYANPIATGVPLNVNTTLGTNSLVVRTNNFYGTGSGSLWGNAGGIYFSSMVTTSIQGSDYVITRGGFPGTENQMLFEVSALPGSNTGFNFTSGLESRLFINGSNGNVGVNISSPAYLLDVNGAVRGNNAIFNSSIGVGTSNPITTLQINNKVTYDNTFNFSNAPFMAIISTPVTGTVLNDTLPVAHFAREGVIGTFGARATLALSRFESNGANSRTRLDFQLANASFDTVNVMTMRSDGRVGINTTTPAYALDVDGTARFTSNSYIGTTAGADAALYIGSGLGAGPSRTLLLQNDNTGNCYIRNMSSSGFLQLGAGNASWVTINSNGNVGINQGAPAYRLDVNGTGRISSIFFNQQLYTTAAYNSGIGGEYHIIAGQDSGNTQWGSYTWYCAKNTGGGLTASTISLYAYPNSGGAYNALNINPLGNVGVGTSAPAYKLDVAGDLRVTRSTITNDLRVTNNIISPRFNASQILNYRLPIDTALISSLSFTTNGGTLSFNTYATIYSGGSAFASSFFKIMSGTTSLTSALAVNEVPGTAGTRETYCPTYVFSNIAAGTYTIHLSTTGGPLFRTGTQAVLALTEFPF